MTARIPAATLVPGAPVGGSGGKGTVALAAIPPSTLTTAQRVAALNAQAAALAKEDVAAFTLEVQGLSKRAQEIAGMGEAVPIGIRERAQKLVLLLESEAGFYSSISQKVP